MAPRRRTKRKAPRRSRAVSALSVLESYMYASILTSNITGNSPIQLVTGATDLARESQTFGTTTYNYTVGAGAISLGDMISQPQLALQAIQSNVMSNYQQIFIQTLATRLAFKFSKKLLRAPISSINRNLFKPLGVGIKL